MSLFDKIKKGTLNSSDEYRCIIEMNLYLESYLPKDKYKQIGPHLFVTLMSGSELMKFYNEHKSGIYRISEDRMECTI